MSSASDTFIPIEGSWLDGRPDHCDTIPTELAHAVVEQLHRLLEWMWVEATTNGCLSPQQRIRLFAGNSLASARLVQVIKPMCDLTRSLSIKRDNPLSRARRDAQALPAHRAVNGEAIEQAGRVWLGIVPQHRRI